MPRRRSAFKRKAKPDPLFNSIVVEKFINKMMLHGKKSLARKIMYSAMEQLSKKTGEENPLIALEQALDHAKPTLEVKSRRIGGATCQVPVEIPPERRNSMAMTWIIMHAKQKAGRNMIDSLTTELSDCYHNQGATIKKKEDTHRMAEANKAFAHYRW